MAWDLRYCERLASAVREVVSSRSLVRPAIDLTVTVGCAIDSPPGD